MQQHQQMANVSGFLISLLLSFTIAVSAGNFYSDVYVNWGANTHAKIYNNGEQLALSLDESSGSGFESNNQYLYAQIDMQLKLVPDNSAGTVTTYYMSSIGDYHDEIDFEFLGNATGEPYILHTNIYCEGKGNKEQQFYLWFDPTADYHNYSIHWTPNHIHFIVDGIPIRQFKNLESIGVPFPKYQPMRIYSSLWDGDSWATRGGALKIDWSYAPFVASYRNFNADNACVWSDGKSNCSPDYSNGWLWEELDFGKIGQMKWARDNYMIYDYCKDTNRFPQGLPSECYVPDY